MHRLAAAALAACLALAAAAAPVLAQPDDRGRGGWHGAAAGFDGRRPDADGGEPRGSARDPDYDDGYDEPRAPSGGTRRPAPRPAPSRAPAAPTAAPDLAPMARVPLFVGTQPDCNAGEVTTASNHKNCATQPIGRTASAEEAGPGAAPLYAGVTANRNAGIVALQANRAGGTGRVIGYMVPAAQGRTRLYVGTGACNAGLVTTSPAHLGCATREIGFTAR